MLLLLRRTTHVLDGVRRAILVRVFCVCCKRCPEHSLQLLWSLWSCLLIVRGKGQDVLHAVGSAAAAGSAVEAIISS